MNTRTRIQTALLCGALMPLAVGADAPVWKIENGDSRLFLAGSIHFLSADDYPLPAAFETAYRRSQVLVLEVDIQQMQSPEGNQHLMRRLSYGSDRSLQQDIGADTYTEIGKFFGARGVPMAQIDRFKPGLVAMMITIVELQRLGLAGEGVDPYFDNRALRDQRPRRFLESIDTQIDFVLNLGAGREDEMLNYTLREAETIAQLMPLLKTAWRDGDMPRLEQLGIEPMTVAFPRVYEAMLVQRNRAWMGRLESMLANRQVEFVVVGALHLAGPDGLLAQLGARGYRIEQLP